MLLALGEADWRSERLVELKDIVAGARAGRVHQDDVTIFKSNGLGLEDVAVAGFVYEKAREAGLGEELYS